MKKNKIALLIWFLVLFAVTSHEYALAQSNTPTPKISVTPTEADKIENSLEKNAQILKDKIATKVAELSKQAEIVITGVVDPIDENSIKIVSDDKQASSILTDSVLTKYKSTSIGDADILERDEIVKGNYLVVAGKKIDNDISANKIYFQTQYLVATGQITEVDESNFTVSVVTTDKDEYLLDVEKTTIAQIMNTSTLELSKAGFTKLKIGDNIHFVIKTPKDSKTKSHSVIRLLIIPQEYFTEKNN